MHKKENTEEDNEEIENIEKCPECQTLTIVRSENRSYEYCEKCGLITRASYDYAAGQKIELPYGLLII
jgi:ribosomal protein L37AE/L43A